jgi:hypothetical protein
VSGKQHSPTAVGLIFAATFIALSLQAGDTYFGNGLSVPNGGSDGSPPLVILGEYNAAGPLPTSDVILPTGTVEDVRFYGQDYDFTLYALSHVSSGPQPNEQTFQVVASETFSGSASSPGVETLAVSGFSVTAGDLLAFAGIGPWYPQNPNDTPPSDATYEDAAYAFSGTPFIATPPGGAGTVFSVGIDPDPSATYDYIADYYGNQGRTYGIGVDVATPDSTLTFLLLSSTAAGLAVMKRLRS